MRKLVVVIAALILLAKVANPDPATDIAVAKQITEWVHDSIEYESSPDIIKKPWATVASMRGDCADMSALILAMLEDRGIHGEMVILEMQGTLPPRHAIVRLWGVLFDAVSGMMFTDEFPLPHKFASAYTFDNILFDWDWRIKK